VIDEADKGLVLAQAVVERVVHEYPRTTIEFLDVAVHGTVVRFAPPNKAGAEVFLIAVWDWSFDIDAGGFKLFDAEPLRTDSESEHIARVVEEILRIAEHGVRRNVFERLIALGQGAVDPWET